MRTSRSRSAIVWGMPSATARRRVSVSMGGEPIARRSRGARARDGGSRPELTLRLGHAPVVRAREARDELRVVRPREGGRVLHVLLAGGAAHLRNARVVVLVEPDVEVVQHGAEVLGPLSQQG